MSDHYQENEASEFLEVIQDKPSWFTNYGLYLVTGFLILLFITMGQIKSIDVLNFKIMSTKETQASTIIIGELVTQDFSKLSRSKTDQINMDDLLEKITYCETSNAKVLNPKDISFDQSGKIQLSISLITNQDSAKYLFKEIESSDTVKIYIRNESFIKKLTDGLRKKI